MSDYPMVTWLHERLNIEEKAAKAAQEAAPGISWIDVGENLATDLDDRISDHILLHRPQHTLFQVAAIRSLIIAHARPHACLTRMGFGHGWEEWNVRDTSGPCPVVRLLVCGYADKPGFQEKWLNMHG